MTRVRVFVDYQNVDHRARGTFDLDDAHPAVGHVRPRRLGALLNHLGKGLDPSRVLDRVCIFRGEPGPPAHPLVQSSFQRQVAAWRAIGPAMQVVTRPLRYPVEAWDDQGRPVKWGRPEEKGIDVLIALSMALGARDDEFDVAVLVSSDTDLVPAIDAVLAARKRVENAVWWPDAGHGRPLRASDRRTWCHQLDRSMFEQVRDDTDYAIERPPGDQL